MLFKKSVSPLIATILLIVVSVILITVVLTWAKGFTQSTTNKATDLLDQSKDISKTGVFWQTSLLGDQLILKNQIIDDIEIKGYKILTNDYNSDYFWLNSYRSLENNILFSPSTLAPITLVCVPTNKFYLELIDINDQSYTLEINPINNRSFTSCNTFNVPLWEFETINGAYTVNTFNKQSGEIVNNGGFDIDSSWTKVGTSIQDGVVKFINVSSANGVYQTGILGVGKKYEITFTILNYVSGGVYVRAGNTSSQIYGENGTFTIDLLATQNTVLYVLSSGSDTKLELDNISAIEIDPLETITDGTNYLENLTAGRKVILSSQAYGSWEFDLYKGNNANPRVHIISDSTSAYNSFQGYMLYIYQDTKVTHFTMSTGSGGSALMVTNSDFVKDLFWYNVKITRDRNNEFTFLIKGPFFTSTPGYDGWTLVSLSSGLNPRVNSNYTTSNYFVIDLDPGDRIANIKLTPEIN